MNPFEVTGILIGSAALFDGVVILVLHLGTRHRSVLDRTFEDIARRINQKSNER